ncbi:MAG: peptidoglycan DD-metalloendopeptidase family protein [Pseudomonadota bacterium]
MVAHPLRVFLLGAGLLAVAACDDFDLRDNVGGFDTSNAALGATAPRPEPDARGVISYPGYQVAVARRGDTVATIASRVGTDAAALARFNGIGETVGLRPGEILALPERVPGETVDIAGLAGAAIEASPEDAARAPAAVETAELPVGPEPVRHRVERGETAFTIARLYNVPVRSLAEWNALDADLTVRTGQFLLIPTAASPRQSSAVAAPVPAPGAGSATPTPPSSTTQLPAEDETPEAQVAAAPAPAEPEVATPADRTEFLTPVTGTVIRGYARGRNEGVDFGTAPGAAVNAAADGTVAAITRDTNDVAIIVIRHENNLLTVYTQVDDLRIEKGDTVRRGQRIASVRAGDPTFLHFEVRDGLESVDPATYLDL